MILLSRWLVEAHSASEAYQISWRIVRELFRTRSPYQEVLIVELAHFGRALFLDGVLQTTARDEFIYHEMLVHVPLLSHPHPRRVLVVGGGDGGTLREVLRHPQVQEADVVELDETVVRACREWMPSLSQGAWEDTRARLVVDEGLAFVSRAPEGAYDVVLVDCSDPEGPASSLYSLPFYRELYRVLAPGGIFVQQALSPFLHAEVVRSVLESASRYFPRYGVYLCPVPSYLTGLQAFAWASKGPDLAAGPLRVPPPGLRWYTPEVHRASSLLPPALAEEILP